MPLLTLQLIINLSDGKPGGGTGSWPAEALCRCGCRADPGTRVKSGYGVVKPRRRTGTCGGAWVGVVHALLGSGERCDCRCCSMERVRFLLVRLGNPKNILE